eukprot:TRINITY_DN4309_c0_g1_i1.p1 TRINITY_DN4309_c0_g1~~TRINITY_DN4309_c0_g1_i1.p1  ORF type:complete len:403 (-),score=78.70 TRINITY_DN4309_c0_g1_i1:830-2038(-)
MKKAVLAAASLWVANGNLRSSRYTGVDLEAMHYHGNLAGQEIYILDLMRKLTHHAEHQGSLLSVSHSVDSTNEESEDYHRSEEIMRVQMALAGLASQPENTRKKSDEKELQKFYGEMQGMVDDLQKAIPDKNEVTKLAFKHAMQSFEGCNSRLENGLKTVLAPKPGNSVPERRQVHNLCRQKQEGLKEKLVSCTGNLDAVKSELPENKCAQWRELQGKTVDELEQVCQAPASEESYEVYLKRVRDDFSRRLDKYRELSNECNNRYVPMTQALKGLSLLEISPRNCSQEQAAWFQTSQECNHYQVSYETSVCSYSNIIRNSWRQYETCWKVSTDNYVRVKNRAELTTKLKKEELKSTTQIKCLLKNMKVAKTEQEKRFASANCKKEAGLTDTSVIKDVPGNRF